MSVWGGDDRLVRFGLGRVWHHPVFVVICAGVGVEFEVHAGLAELVFRTPPVPHPIHDLPGGKVFVDGEELDLPRAATGGGHGPPDLMDVEDFAGFLGGIQGQVNERIGRGPGPFLAVIVGVGDGGEQLLGG